MKLLVLSPEKVGPAEVRGALGEAVEGAEVRVVAPAINESWLAFWVSDSDEAISDADEAQRGTVDALEGNVGSVTGDTGEADPLTALQDALARFPADRILVFVRSDDEQDYREDDVVVEAERRFGIPVTLTTLA